MTVNEAIKALVNYGLECGFYKNEDKVYITNRLLEVLNEDSYDEPEANVTAELEQILGTLCDYARSKGLISEGNVASDLFDTKLMGAMLPMPSEINDKFWRLFEKSPVEATDFFYKFSCDTDYIRRYRIAKDVKWTTPTEYGEIDITINLSKPEKDPKAIAAAKLMKQSGYPQCLHSPRVHGRASTLDNRSAS